MIVDTQEGSNKIRSVDGGFKKKDEGKFIIIPKIFFYAKMLYFISEFVFEVENIPDISIHRTEALIVETQAETERWAEIERN